MTKEALELNRVEQIEALLPQTQCEKCGFKGCKPYAQALAEQKAEINLCHPGGEITMLALAELLDQDPKALPKEALHAQKPSVAVIQEAYCIGCTKCIQVCPVDAIVGATKKLHTVIEKDCTGCELCLPVCPVDCIDMLPSEQNAPTWIIDAPRSRMDKAKHSQQLTHRRQQRLNQKQQAKQSKDHNIIVKTDYAKDISEAMARVNVKRKKIEFFIENPNE